MIVDGMIIDAEVSDVIKELKKQLAEQGVELFAKTKDSGKDVMTQCPYHKDGQERNPSMGIRKEDGMCHCFSGDTKVITREYGAIEMKFVSGFPVHILNGNGEWEQVTFHNYGKQSLMKLTLSCNTKQKVIYATPEHEWLIKNYNKKYQTQNLKVGMYLEKCIPKKRNIKLDPKGIVHGFCYGDGTNFSHNKDKTTYYNRCFFYNKSDLELRQYFTDGKFSREIAGNGKEYECVYFHSSINLKEVPSVLNTDEYIMGFLAGYFVADGNCCNNKLTIYSHKYTDLYRIQQLCTMLGIMSTEIGVSNIKAGKRGCITVKEDTHGYTLRLVRNTIPDNFFITNKGRNSYQKYTGRNSYKVISVDTTNRIEDVYCCQTSTHSFALEHFILTGNCFSCGETHPLTEMIGNCFGRTDPFNEFGKRWLRDNFGTGHIEDRKLDLNLSREPETHEDCQEFVPEEELDSYRYYHPYMRERGLTDDVIELFDIGYDKKTDSITFPVRDTMTGRCKFIARRKIKYKQFDLPKGIDKPLYGLYEIYNLMSVDYFSNKTTAPARLSEIYVCEGIFDCLRLWCNGKAAVAGFGCLFSDYQIKQLEYLPTRKLIFALDNDSAGIAATERLKRLVKGKIMTTVILPEGRKDIGECTNEEILDLRETLY